MIKVLVNGASGRMGSEVVRSIEKEEGLILCGAVDPKCTGQDIGDVVGIGYKGCLLYTSDAADEEDSVDLGWRRIIKKKKKERKDGDVESKKSKDK